MTALNMPGAGPERAHDRPWETPAMDDRQLASAAGLTRIAIGAVLVLAPARANRMWLGSDADRPATRTLIRMVGTRDAILGLGLWRAANGGRSTKAWLAYAALADAADGLATLAGWRGLRPGGRTALLGVAAASAASTAALSARAD
ncbi:MAG TPA: hypothetical protein VF640_06460 [Acidimicrobiales bacterium]|jgi:hypothetical protein